MENQENKFQFKSIVCEEDFKRHILERYDKIGDGIKVTDDGNTVTSISDNDLSRGCQICKRSSWLCLIVGLRCNANCRFCAIAPANRVKDERDGYVMGRTIDELITEIIEQGQKIEGVGYSGGEPLLYLETKLLPIAKALQEKAPYIYQWLYTNGILIDADILNRLRDVGIGEVRLDLAATNFDVAVMDNIPMTKDIIGNVIVKVPSIPEVYDKLIGEKVIHELVDRGVEQISLAEHYVTNERAASYIHDKEVYFSRIGHLSSVESRNITIDIIEYVLKENVPLLINDCSNDAKFWQLLKRKFKVKGIKQDYS